MELFRMTRDVYGQETLAGVSWDLLPWFVGAAAAFIVLHAAAMLVRRPARAATGE
jgi:hypothetical protein